LVSGAVRYLLCTVLVFAWEGGCWMVCVADRYLNSYSECVGGRVVVGICC
jgi:hypothetical protein